MASVDPPHGPRRRLLLLTVGQFAKRSWVRQDVAILESEGIDSKAASLRFRYPTPTDILWMLKHSRELSRTRLVFVWFAFPGPVLLARIFGKPTVLNAIGYEVAMHRWFNYGEPLNPFARVLISFGIRKADTVIAISNESATWAAKLRGGAVNVVYEAIDPAKFIPRSEEFEPMPSSISTVVSLSSGNVVRKDLMSLLRAFSAVKTRFPHARLTVVGEKGDGYPALAKEAESLGIAQSVEFVGERPLNELLSIVQMSAAFVSPSLHEGFPTTLCEAALCGVPIVTTNLPSMNEVFTDGENALLVRPKDPIMLADAICSILSDNDLATRLGSNGRRTIAATYTPEVRGHKLKEVMTFTPAPSGVLRGALVRTGFYILYVGIAVIVPFWIVTRKARRRLSEAAPRTATRT